LVFKQLFFAFFFNTMAARKIYSDTKKVEIVLQILKLRHEGHAASYAYQVTGVGSQLYSYWVNNNAKVIQAVKEFEKREKEAFLADVRNRAKKALHNGLSPQTVKKTVRKVIDSPNGKVTTIEIEEKTVPVHPSLIQFALVNTMAENFTRVDREANQTNKTLEQLSLEELEKRKAAMANEPKGQAMPDE
jgi:hypothetical protein